MPGYEQISGSDFEAGPSGPLQAPCSQLLGLTFGFSRRRRLGNGSRSCFFWFVVRQTGNTVHGDSEQSSRPYFEFRSGSLRGGMQAKQGVTDVEQYSTFGFVAMEFYSHVRSVLLDFSQPKVLVSFQTVVAIPSLSDVEVAVRI